MYNHYGLRCKNHYGLRYKYGFKKLNFVNNKFKIIYNKI